MSLKNTHVVWFVAAALGFSVMAQADSGKDENAQLRQRMEQLERELGEIKKQLSLPSSKPVAAPAELTDQDVARLKEIAGSKKKPVMAGVDLTLYGYVKLDAAYDDSRVSVGNFARWVETESVLKNDSHFSMTANQTRLGVDMVGPQLDGVRTSGKVEIDFYGSGAGENKPDPMLRHAYLRADWPEWRFALLAGQTSDIISPLFPTTINYSVGWWQGNVGYRRPQIRLIKDLALDSDVTLRMEGGLSRTITGRKYVFKDSTDPDTGSDAGFPTVAGHTSITFPLFNKLPATFGVSGHFGAEEIHRTDLSASDDFDTWSLNAEWRLPVTKWLLLQAELFYGANMDSHLGGIGQGINTNTMDIIRSRGGWAQATITPNATWQFNLGGGMDDPLDRELSTNMRASNYFLFGNACYSLSANLQLALELSYLRTAFINNTDGDAWREQFAVIYKF